MLKHALSEVFQQNCALRVKVAELEAIILWSEVNIMSKNTVITQLIRNVRGFVEQRNMKIIEDK